MFYILSFRSQQLAFPPQSSPPPSPPTDSPRPPRDQGVAGWSAAPSGPGLAARVEHERHREHKGEVAYDAALEQRKRALLWNCEGWGGGGAALLFAAACRGDTADVEALLARGAAVNAKCGTLAITPLIGAAREGSEACAHLCLGAGADVKFRSSSGDGALHHAAREGASMHGCRCSSGRGRESICTAGEICATMIRTLTPIHTRTATRVPTSASTHAPLPTPLPVHLHLRLRPLPL